METIISSKDTTTSQQIYELRQAGFLSTAIELCDKMAKQMPYNYFYPKIQGDLYVEQMSYKEATLAYLEFLIRIPPNHKVFHDFARRYYRLKRILSGEELHEFIEAIHTIVKEHKIDSRNALKCMELIEKDIVQETDELVLSDELKEFVGMLGSDDKFDEVVKHCKKLEITNPVELEYVIDKYVLYRIEDAKYFRIDKYFLAYYERKKRFEKAILIANKLLNVRRQITVISSLFRLCRNIENYEYADAALSRFPNILKKDYFPVLYELVYYFEAKSDTEQLKKTLERIRKDFADSYPIQRTLRNFYIRFGMIDEAQSITDRFYEQFERDSGRHRYSDLAKESDMEIGIKIKEMLTEIEHQSQLAAISELTAGISHELGQPITNIRYTIQFYQRVLEKNIDREIVTKVFNSILEETRRMGGLIERLAPITSSRSLFETFNIVERIKKRFEAENPRIKKLNIGISIKPDSPVYFFGDPVRFDQLINNLLVNAIDAISERKTPGQRKIFVRVFEKENSIQITFNDTGVGIPLKDRAKVFKPFYSTKAPGKGEGLGLFIVWNLLKMQGGTIKIAHGYTKGIKFIVNIPKKEKE